MPFLYGNNVGFNEIEREKIAKANKRPKDSLAMSKTLVIDRTEDMFKFYARKGFPDNARPYEEERVLNSVKFEMLGTSDFSDKEREETLNAALKAGILKMETISKDEPELFDDTNRQMAIEKFKNLWDKIISEWSDSEFAKPIKWLEEENDVNDVCNNKAS